MNYEILLTIMLSIFTLPSLYLLIYFNLILLISVFRNQCPNVNEWC